MRPTAISTLVVLLTSIGGTAVAQSLTLPPPSRAVYKCDSGGKTVYSDAPCLGAERLDVVPTRGVNKLTGTERIGPDVRKERTNEQMADALRPLLGESAQQRAVRHRRASLTPEDQQTCYSLDRRIAEHEEDERRASGDDLRSVQQQLFELRSRFRRLRC